jgi:hypothetical protein
MITHVNGFKLEVTRADGLPRVRVSLGDTVIADTDAVSLIGLGKLPLVFETAASLAFKQAERDYEARTRG